MYSWGKWPVVLFLFQYHLWIFSLSLSLCVHLWSIIISLLSLILALEFPLIHHPWVCVRQRLWIMQWPFHWHGPAWPSLDTTGLNSIHHKNHLSGPNRDWPAECMFVPMYYTEKPLYMQTAEAGRQNGRRRRLGQTMWKEYKHFQILTDCGDLRISWRAVKEVCAQRNEARIEDYTVSESDL